MTDTPQLSGMDLARLALKNARAAAPKNPSTGPARSKTKRTRRTGSGRDPVNLAAAITALGADVPMDAGLAGGSILDQWPTLCPQYAEHVQPVHYDETRGRLDLRPASHAYFTQLQLLGGQLAKQINDKMGRPVVRSIRVLPVGRITTPQAAPVPEASEPEAPVKTRESASPGYRATLEAVLQHRPERQPTDPYMLEAIARQEAAARTNRQPETEHRDAEWELNRLTAEADDRNEASRQAAIARARQEKAGGEPRRLFGAA
ncbi:DciA family protein [Streptomyces sp. NPDC089424]|uniref:DciA family protein n=1 Tax=Streptomyces sp. NPDC089424 TaxID=3365917 RepID=UPI003800C819